MRGKSFTRGLLVHCFIFLVFVSTAFAQSKTITIDPTQSRLEFVADSLFGDVSGQFNTWQGTIQLNSKDLLASSVEVVIDVKSIDTKNKTRDSHLRSKSFFHAEAFPQLLFRSKSFKKIENQLELYEVTGDLTIRGVTQEIPFLVEILSETIEGKERYRVKGGLVIKRRDFGINYRSVMNPIKDEVKIQMDVVTN